MHSRSEEDHIKAVYALVRSGQSAGTKDIADRLGIKASSVTVMLKKLAEKRVDVVVANHADASLGRDDNDAALVTADGAEWVGVLPKAALADRILDAVAARLPPR